MTWIIFACVTYVTFADIISAYTLNKLYVLGFAVLVLAPREVTIDYRGQVRPWQSAWPVRVLQASIVVIYFTAGTTKATGTSSRKAASRVERHSRQAASSSPASWYARPTASSVR